MLYLKVKISISEFYSHGKNQWLEILEPGDNNFDYLACLTWNSGCQSGIPVTFLFRALFELDCPAEI